MNWLGIAPEKIDPSASFIRGKYKKVILGKDGVIKDVACWVDELGNLVCFMKLVGGGGG